MLCPALGLKLKYYSTLAAILHVWRDNATEMFSCFLDRFGMDRLKLTPLAKVPPRPLSGRWGRKTQMETHVLSFAPDEICAVFQKVLSTKNYFREALHADGHVPPEPDQPEAGRGRGRGRKGKGKGKHRGSKRKAYVLDDTAADEMENYSKQMGKWAVMAMAGISNKMFWLAMAVSNRISDTLDVLLWTVQQRPENAAVDEPPEKLPLGNLARFLFGSAKRIDSLLQELLVEDTWTPIIAPLVEAADYPKVSIAVMKVVPCLYETWNACDFCFPSAAAFNFFEDVTD